MSNVTTSPTECLSDLSTITKGAGITFVGTAGGKVLLFLYTLFLAKALSPADLGVYFLGITVTTLATSLAMFGLNYGVIRYVAIHAKKGNSQAEKGTVLAACLVAVALGLLVASVIFLAGDFAARSFFHKSELGTVFKLFAIGIPFEILMRIFLAATQGRKFMQYTAFIGNLAWVALRFIFALFFLYVWNLGLSGVVLAYVASSITSALVAFYYANILTRLLDRKVIPVFSETAQLVRFSVPMVFTTFFENMVRQTDILMLGLFVSAGSVGIYSIAVRTIYLAELVFFVFRPIFNPYVAQLHSQQDFARLGSLLKVITRWNVTVSFPIFLALTIVPAFFLRIFGQGFVEAAGCLTILALSHLFSSVSKLPDAIIYMSGRSDISFKNNGAMLMLNVVLNYLLIPKYGITGAAFATGVSLVSVATLRVIEVYYWMRIHPFDTSLWKPVLAGLVSLSAAVCLHGLVWAGGNVLLAIFIGLSFLLYTFLIPALRLNKEDRYMKDILLAKIGAFSR
jgi:O-antigen/teichoic acid export membrane protein